MEAYRESFVMYKNWIEAINALPKRKQLEIYKALSEYGLTGEMPKKITPLAKSLLISFSKGMENAKARYLANVTNGGKGGRPKKVKGESENVEENPTKPTKTQTKTQNNPTKPNDNLNDNVNVNDISLSINKNNLSTHARVRENILEKFKEYFSFWGFEEEDKKSFNEVLDILSKAICKAQTEEGLIFNHKKYQPDFFDNLETDDIRKVVWSLLNGDNIRNREFYILGALIARASENAKK